LEQKIAIVSIQECCTAIESFKAQYGSLPKALSDNALYPLFDWKWMKTSPYFPNSFYDGWNRPIIYEMRSEQLNGSITEHYYLGSAGKDGKWEHPSLKDYSEAMVKGSDRDIVYCDGHAVQWPEGWPKD
jgi:hypothetical protein